MQSTVKLARAAVLAAGIAGLAVPALAQSGNPDTGHGTLSGQQIGPRGPHGTAVGPGATVAPGAVAPGETTGASGARVVPLDPVSPPGVPAGNLGARGEDAPSEVPLAAPKGHIGGD